MIHNIFKDRFNVKRAVKASANNCLLKDHPQYETLRAKYMQDFDDMSLKRIDELPRSKIASAKILSYGTVRKKQLEENKSAEEILNGAAASFMAAPRPALTDGQKADLRRHNLECLEKIRKGLF